MSRDLSKAVFATLFCMVALNAHSHDIYNGVREKGEASGMLCCGGDPKTGDCEAVTYEMQPDGSAIFTSKRYGAVVHVGKPKIAWMSVPGGEWSEAHWCGRPRGTFQSGPTLPVDEEQPDPNFWTYCAFIAPGGV